MSQFAEIFKAVKEPQQKPLTSRNTKKTKSKEENQTVKPKSAKSIKLDSSNLDNKISTTVQIETTTRRAGKSSNPEYTQVLAYIRKTTHKDVRRALLDDETGKDFSDLVEKLLSEWLSKQANLK